MAMAEELNTYADANEEDRRYEYQLSVLLRFQSNTDGVISI